LVCIFLHVPQINLFPQESPSSPSKAGILKTPGTISRRKSVTFNKSSTPETTTTKPVKETPKEKRTSILSRGFPGKYPSPYTPRTRQSTPELYHADGDTDLIPVSRSAMETLAAHVELVLENNKRLQDIIKSGELMYSPYAKYSAHPDLETMKRELEREKEVLKGLFADFEQQQAAIARREKELNSQYTALTRQMEEQHALQSSTAKILEDYQGTIQELNQTIKDQQGSYEKDINGAQARADRFEHDVHELENELDDVKDLLRGNVQEIESKEILINDLQEKLRRTQRQLSQLRMETLESRVGPNSHITEGIVGGEVGNRFAHRRTASRRTVSATYSTTNALDDRLSETLLKDQPPETAISQKPAGSTSYKSR
jgi:myosin heavy subunit